MSWSPVQLPYFVSHSHLPSTLPTPQQIATSDTVYRDDEDYHRVVAIEPHYIVKYGSGVLEMEGQVLLFLEHHACPNVPKLYAMYRQEDTGHLCLVMQRMPGDSLEKLWPSLTEHEKNEVCSQLKNFLTVLRHIPAPNPQLYGSVDGGRFVRHHLFYSPTKDPEICGPFETEGQFNAALVKRVRSIWEDMGHYCFRADYYEKTLGKTLSGHEPVFSHSDLQRKNIIVQRNPDQSLTVSIIDWEEAGWFPTYWEFYMGIEGAKWDDDWPQRWGEILEPWPSETAVLHMVHKDIIF